MKTFLIALFVAGLPSMSPLACRCLPIGDALQEARQADVVFVGYVLDLRRERDSGDHWLIREIKSWFGIEPNPGYDRLWATFEVSQSIKGDLEATVVIRTAGSGRACGYEFKDHSTYLVYALKGVDSLGTDACTRTKPLHEAEQEISELLAQRDAL